MVIFKRRCEFYIIQIAWWTGTVSWLPDQRVSSSDCQTTYWWTMQLQIHDLAISFYETATSISSCIAYANVNPFLLHHLILSSCIKIPLFKNTFIRICLLKNFLNVNHALKTRRTILQRYYFYLSGGFGMTNDTHSRNSINRRPIVHHFASQRPTYLMNITLQGFIISFK